MSNYVNLHFMNILPLKFQPCFLPLAACLEPPPNPRCKTSSYVAEYTGCIPQRAMMSSTHKLWESVIQGQQNKAAKRDSKYITAHFSPPELNWQQ